MNRAFYRHYLRVLSLGTASLMIVQMMLAAQTETRLAIQVLEASAGQNLISQETLPIKVRVLDRTGRAISGANVLFIAPEEGPTGEFLPNATQISVATDREGVATAPRFRTNSTVGDYQIQVIASYRDAVSRAVIPQSNVLKRKSSNKKILIFSALIGGAAAAALAARRGSGPASSALGALAVTPAITLGGESPVSLSSLGTGTPNVGPTSVPSTSLPTAPTFIAVATSTPTTSPPASSSSTPPLPTSPPPPVVEVVQPIPQTQPSISDVCANMPPNSNRKDCR